MQSKQRDWAILGLFFCSGATALVYEVVWSKFLAQMFGSTIYAQTVVLAVFMGGLALGNKLFGRWADGLRRPVQAYGWLELAIGLYALAFPALDRGADGLFVALGTGWVERPVLLTTLKGVLAAGLLLGPTILMGGTLPLLAAWLQKHSADAGRGSARFYSVNSLGAVTGSGLAGFFLVQHFGMVATLQIAAAVNILIALAALWLGAAPAAKPETPNPKPGTAPASTVGAGRAASQSNLPLWAGLTVFFTGGVSMGLEVLAARSLALIFGSSLQSFAIVLMAFILGIGLGAAWIASPKRKVTGPGLIVVLLCLAAFWVAFLVFNIERGVDFYRIARTGLGRTEMGYLYHQLLAGGIALVVLGLPAAWIGAVVPLMIRLVSADGFKLGGKVGALLTWNTLGAVTGVLFTGFVLMPVAGLRGAFVVLGALLATVAIMFAWRSKFRLGKALGAVALVFCMVVLVTGGTGWKHVMSSGIFRVWETSFQKEMMALRKAHLEILFYEDAPDATVTVERYDGWIPPASTGLRINGKPDAGTGEDLNTQLLVAHLPMLFKPEAQDVFMLGLGSGISAGALLAHEAKNIVLAENCAPVIRASDFFLDWNRDVTRSPRVRLMNEDARTILKLHPQTYDVIICEPSNPWTVGVGSIFSEEFYKLAASRLKPGGIMAQWFHVYETDDEVVDLVLRTFSHVFPHVEIWDAAQGDIIMLGSLTPWASGPDVFRAAMRRPEVSRDLAMIDIHTPEMLLARQLASQRTGAAVAGPGPLQTDLHPRLEYIAPKAFFIGGRARLFDRYDERTRQQLLAPPAKNAVLAELPLVGLQKLFGTFSTVNGELSGAIFGTPSGHGVPCVFPTPNPAPPPEGQGTLLGMAAIALNAGELNQAAQMIHYALQQQPNNLQAQYLKRVLDLQLRQRR
ncbi:MAG: fused MFS/spermidine synthase [Limisphaerales bacterium]